ncbi:hypothetical protein OEV98_13145 [Caldibacillus lycopersici]|uniref:Membrane protein NfeD2 N-terminal transmembrane domain-containing protein n=1 Tax=Perspicuibacillus lycopersici TaxID=1325689 RepID=A0AAE3LNA6_9BACI|nr:hypothetical protein [Perspicuibacillus lycopersici]MCU9614485.1 hypothetical protein [Perspicuibacillus lycopersici]
MELFGMPIQNVYLWVLLIAGALTLLYILFGDFLDAVGEGIPFLNPVIILVFLIFHSASGYVMEQVTAMNSWLIMILSALLSVLLTALLHIFVLVPLSSAEESLAYTDESLKGRLGTTIIPIPKDGYGEVLIESNSGRIAKSAVSFEQEEIGEGIKVLIVDVQKGVLYVTPYDEKSIYRT